MSVKTCTITVQDVNGVWHQLGAGALRGVWPEDIELVSDEWGPKTATFALRRDPEVAWPDLGAYAPMEATVGGRLRWTGRIIDAPTSSSEHVISVQAEGWQAHLDDDQYERKYVITRLSDWKDARGHLEANLASYTAAWQVEAADRGLKISYPAGQAAGGSGMVYLDAGPGSTIKQIAWQASSSAWAANNALYVLAGDTFAGLGEENYAPGSIGSGTSYTDGWTLTTPRRFVAFRIDSNSHTPGSDEWFKLEAVICVAESAYISGLSSILRGDQVLTDALDKATMLLSSDRSRVEQTTDFSIPEHAADGPRTPRQAAESMNVFFDHQIRIDEQLRAVFRERPNVPDVKIGKWGGSEFDDASNVSGADVFSRVIARGEDPAGQPVSVTRTQGDQPGVTLDVLASPSIANPSFAADNSGWSAVGSTITRDTGVYDTTPASGRWDNTGASDALGALDKLIWPAFTGTFLAGHTYVLQVALRASSGSSNLVFVDFGENADHRSQGVWDGIGTTFQTFQIAWTPTVDAIGALRLQQWQPIGAFYYIDSVEVLEARPTIVDKRGFRKTHTLDSGFTLTSASGQRLADKYLQAHKTTPFKGKGQAVGHGAIRDYANGQAVSPDTLLVLTGGLMHFDHLIDPDTGNLGRDGRLVRAAYRPETDTVAFDIDSTRGDFDRMLQRAGVLVGQLR